VNCRWWNNRWNSVR